MSDVWASPSLVLMMSYFSEGNDPRDNRTTGMALPPGFALTVESLRIAAWQFGLRDTLLFLQVSGLELPKCFEPRIFIEADQVGIGTFSE